MKHRRPAAACALYGLALALSGQHAIGQTNVLTQHNDIGRTGQNLNETVLTPANVNVSQFGRIYTIPTDGQANAQPLYMGSVTIGGAAHSVLFVATENDSVYAFDTAAKGAQLWKASLLDTAHGAAAGAIADPQTTSGCSDQEDGLHGISGTPVIDPTTGTLYVVSRSNESGAVVQRLHALDITTGNEKFGGPVVIKASVAGTASDARNGLVTFNTVLENQRPALLLVGGSVYVSFGSFCDNPPWHGWMMQYNAATLAQTAVFLTTPNGTGSGIWLSGGGPAADIESGVPRVFVATGNGTFDASAPYNTNAMDFGDDILRFNVTNGMTVSDSFTPLNQATLQADDADVGAGGVLILPDNLPGSPVAHLAVQVDKVGTMFLLNRDTLGGYNTSSDNVLQEITAAPYLSGLWGTPAYWNGNVYFWPAGTNPEQYRITNGLLSTSPVATGPDPGAPTPDNFEGATPSVSANGTTNGIVWFNDWASCCTAPTQALYAYNATNISTLLWSSVQNPVRDDAGPTQKFGVPTIADGKVFLGTRNMVVVYGLLANQPVTGVPVNLAKAANVYAIGTSGVAPTGGGIDGSSGYVYASNLLGSSLIWNSTNFSFGTPGTLNGVSNATIPLPAGNDTMLALLATGVNGVQQYQTFTVTYTDGTTTSLRQNLSDWSAFQGFNSESQAASTAYRVGPTGATQAGTWSLYGYLIPLNSAKQVSSLALPDDRNVVVLAASLTPVTAAPAFTLTPTVNPGTLQQNTGGTETITVTPLNGFSGTVSLSITGLPSGATGTFSGNALTVFVSSATPTGTYPLTITGTSGAITATAPFSLIVTAGAPFSLSPAVTNGTLAPGQSGGDLITVKPANGFSAAVSFAISGLPAGVTASFSPVSSATSSTLNVRVAAGAKAGTYPLTITATAPAAKGAAAVSESVTVTLVIS